MSRPLKAFSFISIVEVNDQNDTSSCFGLLFSSFEETDVLLEATGIKLCIMSVLAISYFCEVADY